MKSRYVALAACIGIVAIGLGLVILLRANGVVAGNSAPTTQALATSQPKPIITATPTAPPSPASSATATGVAYTATALPSNTAQAINPAVTSALPIVTAAPGFPVPTQTGPYIFQGSYFAVQVPAGWEVPYDNADAPTSIADLGELDTMPENAEWAITGKDRAYVNIRTIYGSYSQELTDAPTKPFQAGSLAGEIWTTTDTETGGFTTVEIVLPGTSSNSGPFCYRATLQVPITYTNEQRDNLIKQFKSAVAGLTPSAFALQSTPTAIPVPAGVEACRVANLSAKTDGQGCTGFFCGILTLTNTGPATCALRGRPVPQYVTPDGTILPIQEYILPATTGNADSALMLQPGKSAMLIYRTGNNYCNGQSRLLTNFRLMLPNTGEQLIVPDMEGNVGEFTPSLCSGGKYAGMIEMSTFKPVK